MTHTDRRHFIKQGLLGTASVAAGSLGTTARSYAQIRGANDRIAMAVIGIRNQGTVHLENLVRAEGQPQRPDPHAVRHRRAASLPRALTLVEQKTGLKPGTEWDLHRVLEDK